MKKWFRILSAVLLLGVLAGCATERLPAEDLDVLTVCRPEIEVLQSPNLPPNSKEKYEAAKSLLKKVDFSYIRRVETLDAIFSSVDALVDNPKSRTQVLSFYYQYRNRSIRFLFSRYNNIVTRFEVIEK
jgi:hypothetical protein